jgi:hypothetical protein
VIGGLYDDKISHEVRAEEEGKGFDDVGFFGDFTREGDDGELFVGAEHDEVRAEANASGFGFVVVDLDSRVVRGAVGDYAERISFGGSSSGLAILLKSIFHSRGEVLCPSFFIRLKHVGGSSNSSDTTSLDISDIDTFVLIKRSGSSFFKDLNSDRRNIVAWTVDHPSVSGISGS